MSGDGKILVVRLFLDEEKHLPSQGMAKPRKSKRFGGGFHKKMDPDGQDKQSMTADEYQ
jgi:hypothetical protein